MPPPDVTEAAAATTDRLPPPADRLPTLTEVVLLGSDVVHADTDAGADLSAPVHLAASTAAGGGPPYLVPALDMGLSAASLLASPLPGGPSMDAQALAHQVLADVVPRIDALFEARLREALAPALARAADGLIREARSELSLALRDLVHDAVSRALKHDTAD
jgi:hypothetical protein